MLSSQINALERFNYKLHYFSSLRCSASITGKSISRFREQYEQYGFLINGCAAWRAARSWMPATLRISEQLYARHLQQWHLDEYSEMWTSKVQYLSKAIKFGLDTTSICRCKHLPKPPKNGMVIAPKMEHNMKARFKCKDGFMIKGREFIECSYGNWTGEIPICQEGIYERVVETLMMCQASTSGIWDIIALMCFNWSVSVLACMPNVLDYSNIYH